MSRVENSVDWLGNWDKTSNGDHFTGIVPQRMNVNNDKELSDLLDFSAMFSPPNSLVGAKPSASIPETVLSSSVHGPRTAGIDETIGSTWPTNTPFDTRGFPSDSHGGYLEDDDFLSRKALSSSYSGSYINSNSLANLGKSKDPYSSSFASGFRESSLSVSQGLPPPLQSSHDVSLSSPDWRTRKFDNGKNGKNNASVNSAYSPSSEEMMSHTGDGISQAYHSPKPGMYHDSYFIEHGSPDPWGHGHGGQLAPSASSYSGSSSSYSMSMSSNYGMHPHDSMDVRGMPQVPPVLANSHSQMRRQPVYHMSHGETMDRLGGSQLPPMSTFRQGSIHGQSSPYLHPASVSPPPLNGNDPGMMGHGHRIPSTGSQTGDALGKALASIYSTDTAASYPSNPSTPVASPPPLTSVNERPLSAGSVASVHSGVGGVTGWARSNQPQSPPYDSHLHPMGMQVNKCAVPPHNRIEERLDDAILVLRNHAEGAPHPMQAAMQGQYVGGANIPNQNYSQTMQSTVTPIEQLAAAPTGLEEHSVNSLVGKNESVPLQKSTKSSTSSVSSTKSSKQKKNSMTDDDDEDDDDDFDGKIGKDKEEGGVGHERDKQVREQERRYANNARERLRVRDINEAFKELGRMCSMHLQSDKPQTKLTLQRAGSLLKALDEEATMEMLRDEGRFGGGSGSMSASDKAQTKLVILHQAVSVITSLESQVRERNLNPKAACLKRREEEKVEGEQPEKQQISGIDKPFDNTGGNGNGNGANRGRARRARRSSRGEAGYGGAGGDQMGDGSLGQYPAVVSVQ